MSLKRDPEKLRAWQRRSRGTLKRSSMPRRPKAKNAAKEGPQWTQCHTLECAACFAIRESWHGIPPVDWTALSHRMSGPPCDGHHEHSEYGNMRRDEDTMPLGTSRARGGCGHHEDRTAQGCARFWGWRRTGPGLWERVPASEREAKDTWLDVNPGLILIEMRSRVC